MPDETTEPANHYIREGLAQTNTAYGSSTNGTFGDAVTIRVPNDSDLVGNYKVVENNNKISPQLFFTYAKKKMGMLERFKLDGRLKKVEQAFDNAVKNGQNMMAEKILNDIVRETRESLIAAKGIHRYIERAELHKYKWKVKDGHISDTVLKNYMRVIPPHVLSKIDKVRPVFDDFVIYHYYQESVEKKREEKQKMTPTEKAAHRDPIVFGIIKQTDRLYFIADWEDEYCDLTFDEIVNVIGSKDISKKPEIGK